MTLTNKNKEQAKASNDLLFARQPIFDGERKLYAYELLYRDKNPNMVNIEDGDKATSSLVVNYCGSILDEKESPLVKIFINLTRKLLLSDYFFPLDPNRLVIEILEDIEVDEKLTQRISQLRKQGYQFALDDYSFDPRFDPLIPLVDYIKVDLINFAGDKLRERILLLKENALNALVKPPALLAEKVEDQAMYDQCLKLGFELFQGYFLERPMPVYGKKINSSSKTALQIVAQLQQSDVDIDALSRSISRDVKLSYQILKIINSPLCRLPKKVSSLHEAVVFLGLEQIKKWSMAMVLAGNSSQPKELFLLLLTRARACELLAKEKKYQGTEGFFTVGLLSGIDAVMLADKAWLINQLDLSLEIIQALLKYKGKKGKILESVIALEKQTISSHNLEQQEIISLYSCHEQAVSWANNLFHIL